MSRDKRDGDYTAVIKPLPDGRAELRWRGVEQTFRNSSEALSELRQHPFLKVEVLPFPPLSPQVLAVSPVLTP